MKHRMLGLAALVALVSVASAAVAVTTNVVAAAPVPRSSVPAAGDVRILELGGGERVDFVWWPPGQGPRKDASVRRVSPQPGLWAGGVEWRAVGRMATPVRVGAWVASAPLTGAQRARILWPGAPAETPAGVVFDWLNARVAGGGFSVEADIGDMLVRRCASDAEWRCPDLETRTVVLDGSEGLVMVRAPDKVGGYWLGPRELGAEDRARILPSGLSSNTPTDIVMLWLNARVAGGGFMLATDNERRALGAGERDMLIRCCGADAGWRGAALQTATVTLPGNEEMTMAWVPSGVTSNGFWVARKPLGTEVKTRLLPRGWPMDTPLETVLRWLNAQIAGGGFAVATDIERKFAGHASEGLVLVRRCGAGAKWRYADVVRRAVVLGTGLDLTMTYVPEGTAGGGFWVTPHGLAVEECRRILPVGMPLAPVETVLQWLNARVAGGGFANATAEERKFAGPGYAPVLARRCGRDAGWNGPEVRTRKVDLGRVGSLEMAQVPEGAAGGGCWVALAPLPGDALRRLLSMDMPADTPTEILLNWLNAQVAGGGFALASGDERLYAGPGEGDVLVRRGGTTAGWRGSGVKSCLLDLGGGTRWVMLQVPAGAVGAGCWFAPRAITRQDLERLLPRDKAKSSSMSALLDVLNARVAGGGFAVATGDLRRYGAAGRENVLVRQCGPGAGWWCPGLATRLVALGAGRTLELVPVASGSFLMGSNTGDQDERPIHSVRLSRNFWMGKTEVTQGQWHAVMGTDPGDDTEPNLPVANVTWYDCQSFMARLNAMAAATAVASTVADGGSRYEFRLPTEAEWEFVSRAGTAGNHEADLRGLGWYSKTSGGTKRAAGLLLPNAWGLHDLRGSVWEWCQDRYGQYRAEDVTDPVGPEFGLHRVLRGGGWSNMENLCRSAKRVRDDPSSRRIDQGFRVVLAPALGL